MSEVRFRSNGWKCPRTLMPPSFPATSGEGATCVPALAETGRSRLPRATYLLPSLEPSTCLLLPAREQPTTAQTISSIHLCHVRVYYVCVPLLSSIGMTLLVFPYPCFQLMGHEGYEGAG